MTRSLTIRLFIGVLVIAASVMLVSYVRTKASQDSDPNSETGKCQSGKIQTEIILWESLTHNLLSVRP
jgi:flagellar basal body-associated protein FliL